MQDMANYIQHSRKKIKLRHIATGYIKYLLIITASPSVNIVNYFTRGDVSLRSYFLKRMHGERLSTPITFVDMFIQDCCHFW